MNTRVYQKSFAGGEIAPEMFGRIDDVKYQNGAAKLRNMLVKPQGAARKRPGFEFRKSTTRTQFSGTDTRTTKSRLIPFVFAVDEAVVLEFRGWDGVPSPERYGTIRIHNDTDAVAYQATTPYIEPITVTFSNDGGFARVGSAAWTGIGTNTPPFAEGERVCFRTTGTLPSGIVAGQIYYVRYATNPLTGFHISATATGTKVSWTTAGTGTHTIDKFYPVGSAVTRSGLTYVAMRDVYNSVTVQYPTNASLDGYWFQQLSTSLELRHSYTEQELFEITYTQSFDVLTIAHPNHPVRELRRYASNVWQLTESSFNTTPQVTGLTATSEYGMAWRFDWVGADRRTGDSSSSLYSTTCIGPTDHEFSVGDLVYCRAPYYSPLNNRFLTISSVDNNRTRTTISETNFSGAWREGAVVVARVEDGKDVFIQFGATFTSGATYPLTLTGNSFSPESWVALNHIRDGTAVRFLDDYGGIGKGAIRYMDVNPSWPGTLTFRLLTETGAVSTPSAATGNTPGLAISINGKGSATGDPYAGYTPWPTEYPDRCGLLQPVSSIQDATNSYKVTALVNNVEGPASASVTVLNNLLALGSKNTLSWTAVAGASSYNVYKEVSGLFGYIGRSDSTSFIDDNITPDFSQTPPYIDTVFNAAGLYPGAVAYFDQRKCFAGALDEPNKLYMSKPFTETEFSYRLPSNDTDRIEIEIAAREANRIRHIVPLGELLLMSNSSEWRVSPINSEALTPSTISVRPQSYIGANSVQPVIVNNSAIFCAARGGHVREMGFNFQAQGFVTGDLSLRAPHLFDDYTISDMAYQKAPVPVLWFVSSSGKLLGLTYVPEEQVGGWHQHDTDGVFESVCVVPGGQEDRVWAVVRRTVNNATVRYVERMAQQYLGDLEDAVHVDSAKIYTGAAIQTMTGLSHLEGKTVSILADGQVLRRQVVSSGSVPLVQQATGSTVSATTVIVGLPIEAELQTTPVSMQIDGLAQGRVKAVNKAWLKVHRSVSLKAGPSGALSVPAYPYDTTGALKTEEIDVTLMPAWQKTGQVTVLNDEPVPLTVLGMTYEVAVGG
jgi:hypothetical protein